MMPDGTRGYLAIRPIVGKRLVLAPGEPFPPLWSTRDLLDGLAESLGLGRNWQKVARRGVWRGGRVVALDEVA